MTCGFWNGMSSQSEKRRRGAMATTASHARVRRCNLPHQRITPSPLRMQSALHLKTAPEPLLLVSMEDLLTREHT